MEEQEKKAEETKAEEKKAEKKTEETKSCKCCACADLRTLIIAFLVSVIVVAGYHVGRICLRRYLRGNCQTTRTARPCRCEMRCHPKFGPERPGCPAKFGPERPDRPRRPRRGKHGRKPWMNKPAAECGKTAPAPAQPAEAPKAAPEAKPAAPAPAPAPATK